MSQSLCYLELCVHCEYSQVFIFSVYMLIYVLSIKTKPSLIENLIKHKSSLFVCFVRFKHAY